MLNHKEEEAELLRALDFIREDIIAVSAQVQSQPADVDEACATLNSHFDERVAAYPGGLSALSTELNNLSVIFRRIVILLFLKRAELIAESVMPQKDKYNSKPDDIAKALDAMLGMLK